MAKKKGFQAVVLDDLNDEQLEEMVLSNWHKLNIALKAGQSEAVLKRLLICELKKGATARPNVAERIRSSLYRAMTKRSRMSLMNTLDIMCNGVTAGEVEESLIEELTSLGIGDIDCSEILLAVTS